MTKDKTLDSYFCSRKNRAISAALGEFVWVVGSLGAFGCWLADLIFGILFECFFD